VAGIPPEAQFAVKPRQARAMIAQAIAAGCHSGGSPPIDLRASLLEAAVSAALPAPFASVASVADREGLG